MVNIILRPAIAVKSLPLGRDKLRALARELVTESAVPLRPRGTSGRCGRPPNNHLPPPLKTVILARDRKLDVRSLNSKLVAQSSQL